MTLDQIANKFEDLVLSGKMSWKPYQHGDLDEFSYYVVQAFLAEHKFEYFIGTPKIGKAICVKITDNYLQYLDIYPEQMKYQWSTDNHRKGVMPDDALKYLIQRTFPGMKIEPQADGTLLINDTVRLGGNDKSLFK